MGANSGCHPAAVVWRRPRLPEPRQSRQPAGHLLRFGLCSLLALAAFAVPATHAEDLTRGDAAYARRAAAERDGRAAPAPIRAAILAYSQGLVSDPPNLENRWKLLRALHFEGEFTTSERAAKLRSFDRALAASEQGIALLAERIGAGKPPHRLDPEELRERLEPSGLAEHDVAAFYFWSAINWGAWSQAAGLLGAVRRGVANRLRDYALVVLALEPAYEQGGADRLLAALHSRLPRIPFVSGWVDRSEALTHAERAFEIGPKHPGNRLLLAATLLDLHPSRRAEALRLLEQVSEFAPRPTMRVEDLAIRREARERLERERGS